MFHVGWFRFRVLLQWPLPLPGSLNSIHFFQLKVSRPHCALPQPGWALLWHKLPQKLPAHFRTVLLARSSVRTVCFPVDSEVIAMLWKRGHLGTNPFKVYSAVHLPPHTWITSQTWLSKRVHDIKISKVISKRGGDNLLQNSDKKKKGEREKKRREDFFFYYLNFTE